MESEHLEQSVSLLTRHERACQREIRESFSGIKVDRGQLIRPRESFPAIFAGILPEMRDKTSVLRFMLLYFLAVKLQVHLYFDPSNF